MTVAEFVQYSTDALFLLIFFVVVAESYRRPGQVRIEATLFFGAAAFILIQSLILRETNTTASKYLTALDQILLLSLAYLLLRLVDSLSEVPPVVLHIGEFALALLAVQSLAGLGDQRFSFVLPAVIYFIVFTIYATVIAVKSSRRAEGVTKNRLRAVAAGSICLGSIILVAGVAAFVPRMVGTGTHVTNEFLALACGVSYFIAFATPLTLRRAWQEPVIRDFFTSAVALPQMSDRETIIRRIEDGVRASLGGIAAAVALWDEDAEELVFPTGSIGVRRGVAEDMIEGVAMVAQDTVYSSNLARDFPKSAAIYLTLNVNAVVSAPITSRNRRVGTLSVYLSGTPMFVDNDLELLRLMANQASVILESRELIEEETRLRAREEALRLRNDFLASVAHDLKTPLTALVMQSQLLERRARREPDAPADVEGLHQIIVQTHRLRSFIEDLLDVQRSEEQGIALTYEACDLGSLIREIGQRVCVDPHIFCFDADDHIEISGDRARLTQLFDNLIGNAVKYSPNGGEIRVRAWQDDESIHVVVIDQGIGISAEDLPYVFDRHHRGNNAKQQGVHGIGLGLFICRAIVRAHGGTLGVESEPGNGSMFHVTVPIKPALKSVALVEPRLVAADGEEREPVATRDRATNRIALEGNPGG
jgi:signal transduction histidine kinase